VPLVDAIDFITREFFPVRQRKTSDFATIGECNASMIVVSAFCDRDFLSEKYSEDFGAN
jgi:hypothetical protein